MRRVFVVVPIFLFLNLAALPARAQAPAAGLQSAMRRAEQVVVAAVVDVQAVWKRNKWGDELIVSRARVRPTETLKGGPGGGEVAIELEGGTIGGLTLKLSHAQTVARGDRAVFLLTRDETGALVPTDHGAGVLKLTADDRLAGTNLRLEDVRRAAAAAR